MRSRTATPGGPEYSPLPGHMDICVTGQRPWAKGLKGIVEVPWEETKRRHPEHADACLRPLSAELPYLKEDFENQLVKHVLNTAGHGKPKSPDEVRSTLLVQMSWARSLLSRWISPERASRLTFLDEEAHGRHTRTSFIIYPDGTLEKSETWVADSKPLNVKFVGGSEAISRPPPGYVTVQTDWVAQTMGNELRFGQETRHMPKAKHSW
jgi:hypothetical protein